MKKFNITLTVLALIGLNAFAAVQLGSKGSGAIKTSGSNTAGTVITGVNDTLTNLGALGGSIAKIVIESRLQEAKIKQIEAETQTLLASASSRSGDSEDIKSIKKAIKETAKAFESIKENQVSLEEAINTSIKNINIMFSNMQILENMIKDSARDLGTAIKDNSADINSSADFANGLEVKLNDLNKKSKQGVDLSELESKINNLEKLSRKVANLEDALNRIDDLEKKVNELSDANEIRKGI